MDWIQFILFVCALGGMYWSLKSDFQKDKDRAYEDRKDIINLIRNSEREAKEARERSERESREFKERSEKDAREFREQMSAFREQMSAFREQMAQESKDFHGRLCTLEERYLQILQNKAKVA